MKTLYLDCAMGAAGDMLTAALFSLLSDEKKEEFLTTMNGLMPEITVSAEPRTRCGILGCGMNVLVNGAEEEAGEDPGLEYHHEHEHDHEHHHDHDHEHDHHHEQDHEHHHDHDHEHHHHHVHRGMAEITAAIDSFAVPEAVKEKAKAVYARLAAAESAAHGVPVEEIHFHEVGALDAVADVTGACLALYLLAPERVIASPVNVGNGQVRAAHGILPVPAPATATILSGIPYYQNPERVGELCTPTGAALLAAFADEFGPMPVLRVEKAGYGMGKKEFAAVNGVRAMIGEETVKTGGPNQRISELSVNVDDMTGEQIGYAFEQLLAAGALDVYATPIFMKKNRPAQMISLLCKEADTDKFAALMLQHTTSFGVRVRACSRYAMDITFSEEETDAGTVHVKTGTGYGVTKSKREYEDVAALARKAGKGLREI